MNLLPANMKHCIQLQLLPTASVLNAAMTAIISIDANNWNDVTWGVGQFSGSGGGHNIKIYGMKDINELYTSMHFVLTRSVLIKKFN